MNTKPIHIGIIGGMGPQASVLLHNLIIKACTDKLGVRECHEFPLVTHVSAPIVDFISNSKLGHKNKQLLRNAVKSLRVTPVDIAVIACNSAHLFLDEVPELGQLPLITLPGSVVEKAQKCGAKRLGLLSTSVTVKTGLYEKYAKSHELELIVPDSASLKNADCIIRATIAGQSGENEVVELKKMIDELRERGAQRVALGCTELSVIMHDRSDDNLIDALTAAEEAIIQKMREIKEGR